jgi:hypothetical protein
MSIPGNTSRPYGFTMGVKRNAVDAEATATRDACGDLRMTEGTLFGLTDQAWVMWFCVMGLWTIGQALFNLARAVRND